MFNANVGVDDTNIDRLNKLSLFIIIINEIVMKMFRGDVYLYGLYSKWYIQKKKKLVI